MAYVDVKCASCGHQSLVDPLVAARMKTCPACGAALKHMPANDSPAPEAVAANEKPDASTRAGAGEPAPPPERRRWRLLNRRWKLGGETLESPPPAATAAEDSSGAPPTDTSQATTTASHADAGEPRLRLDRAGVAGGPVKNCPSCGVVMLPAEKICTMCGYNTETNRFVQQEHARRELIRRSLAALGVVLVLCVGGWLAHRRGALPHPRQWPRFFVPPPEAPTSDVAAPPPAPPARTEQEIAELAAAFENTVRRELDERHPMVIQGEQVELVRTNGLAITGVFRGLTHRDGALLDVERVLQEIPLDDLRPSSRARVDGAYREARIKAEARRRAETGQAE